MSQLFSVMFQLILVEVLCIYEYFSPPESRFKIMCHLFMWHFIFFTLCNCTVISNLPKFNMLSLCSQDQSEYNSTTIRSQTNTVVIRGLKSGSIYVFQVRARTVAGFGRYSGKLYFQTRTEGENSADVHQSTQASYHLSCMAFQHII